MGRSLTQNRNKTKKFILRLYGIFFGPGLRMEDARVIKEITTLNLENLYVFLKLFLEKMFS